MSVEALAHPGEIHGDTKPMKVANMTFLINRLGEDCAPLQFVRELTQNGLDALRILNSSGKVIWDVDWAYHDLSNGVLKLACIDTGAGMTGQQMVRYINELSSSIHQQSRTGNFGVGAKIAAVPLNPHGLVYMSWVGGVGHMIHLWFDSDEQVYGLKRWPQNGGEFWTPVSNELKPKEIDDHGTMVVLLGHSDGENTIEAPTGAPMKSRWLLRYLNTRYFRFPEGVEVKAREGWSNPRSDSRHNFLRVVEGQGSWLDKNCSAQGQVRLSNAQASWWILREDVDRDSGHFAPGGHTAALFQNELYEMSVSRAGIARLQGFGVIFGTDRVVIYVEPDSTDARPVTANTARTQLLLDGEPLDWSDWAAEFREAMPDEIQALQEQIGSKAGEKDHRKAISERLRQIKDLLRFSRYRPVKDGSVTVDPDGISVVGEQSPGLGARDEARETAKQSKGGKAGDIYALFAEAGPENAEPISGFDEPRTQWVSVKDGTRIAPDLDDRAAKFLVQQNLLMINGDFRVFTDMVDRWDAAYGHIPGAAVSIREVVHEWFEQQLVETVMSARALKGTGRYSFDELQQFWSEAALTAAVLPRWHIDQSIKRNLGMRLGSLKQAA